MERKEKEWKSWKMKLIPIQHIISIHFTRINFRYLKYSSHCSYYKKLLEKNPNIQTFKSGPKKFHIWTPSRMLLVVERWTLTNFNIISGIRAINRSSLFWGVLKVTCNEKSCWESLRWSLFPPKLWLTDGNFSGNVL